MAAKRRRRRKTEWTRQRLECVCFISTAFPSTPMPMRPSVEGRRAGKAAVKPRPHSVQGRSGIGRWMAAKRRRRRKTEWTRQRLECACFFSTAFPSTPMPVRVISRRLSHKKAAVKPHAVHTLARLSCAGTGLIRVLSHPIPGERRVKGSKFPRKTNGCPKSGVKSFGRDEQDEQDGDRPGFVGNPVHLVDPVVKTCGTAVQPVEG